MITLNILNLIVIPLKLLISASLPSIAFQFSQYHVDCAVDLINRVSYIFPVKHLLNIMLIDLAINGFSIAWSLVLRIKSFIPTMGN